MYIGFGYTCKLLVKIGIRYAIKNHKVLEEYSNHLNNLTKLQCQQIVRHTKVIPKVITQVIQIELLFHKKKLEEKKTSAI